jgi:hypothetical protein
MKMTDKNYFIELKDKLEEKILSIFSFDSLEVRARVTFDSYIFQGVQVTYWMDDASNENIEKTINNIFDILFEEMIRNRKLNKSVIKV